jgi:cytochrome P450
MPITPTGGFPHAANKDDEYMGYIIPKGANVVNNVWTINNTERRAQNPRDFIPERYKDDKLSMGESANGGDPGKRDHYTFGAGRRICPGIHIAERNLFLAVACLLWAFDIHKAKDANGKEIDVPKEGLQGALIVYPHKFE